MTTSQNPTSEISALKEQLQRTQLAYQMASEMSQFKAGFLARISHELRSPLSKMMSLQQLILSDLCEDSAEERECVAQSYKAAQNLQSLLDEILQVARTEYGTRSLEMQPLQLAQVLSQVHDLTHLQAANRNHRLQIESIDPDIYVLADPRWLRQVLLNLVDTPLKVMSDSGSVYVSTHLESTSGYIHIWVEDQRPASTWSEPIDLLKSAPKINERVLEKYSLSPGLTLLINQTLLELMKGRLEILAVPSPDEASNLTRIQCSIALANLQMRESDEN